MDIAEDAATNVRDPWNVVPEVRNNLPDLKNDGEEAKTSRKRGIQVETGGKKGVRRQGTLITSMDEIDRVGFFPQKLRKIFCDTLDHRVNRINVTVRRLDGVARK